MSKLRFCWALLVALVVSFAAEKVTKPNSRLNSRDGQTYIWIPAGTFMMGCPSTDPGCYGWETPSQEEQIKQGFWIGKTEVTQQAFFAVTAKNPSRYQHDGERRPVEQVSWNDAKGYCEAIGMRLPTEAEWEYAARAGSEGPYYGKLEEIAWYEVNTRDETKEAARQKPNAFGVYDMIGNVWEWVEDSYADDKEMRVLRGGAFLSGERDLRVSNRSWAMPDAAYRYMGFRCVDDDPEP